MIRPYSIIDGEIVEHKLSYDMIVNSLEKPKEDVKIDEEKENKPVIETCSCGKSFERARADVNHCDACYDIFDSHRHYELVQRRNK